MRYCPNCGSPLPQNKNINFCTHCGAKISEKVTFYNSNSLLRQNVKLDNLDHNASNMVNASPYSKHSNEFAKNNLSQKSENANNEFNSCKNTLTEVSSKKDENTEGNSTCTEAYSSTEKRSTEYTSDTHTNVNKNTNCEKDKSKITGKSETVENDRNTSEKTVTEDKENELDLSKLFVSENDELEETSSLNDNHSAVDNEAITNQQSNLDSEDELQGETNITNESQTVENNRNTSEKTVTEDKENELDLSKLFVSENKKLEETSSLNDNHSAVEQTTVNNEEPQPINNKNITGNNTSHKNDVQYVAENTSCGENKSEQKELSKSPETDLEEGSRTGTNSHISFLDIDPMFGDAPTFDIEEIKRSYIEAKKANSNITKKNTNHKRRGLFVKKDEE